MKDSTLAEIYGVNESSIRRWRRAGKIHDKPAPLHDAAKMESWWQAMMELGEFSKGVPASVIAAAARLKANLPPSDDDDDAAQTPPAGSDPELEKLLAKIAAGSGFSYGDGVAVAERNVQVNDLLLVRAVRAGDEKKIGALQKRLNDSQDILRSLLRDRGKIQADAGALIERGAVREEMLKLHGTIQKRLRLSLKGAFLDFAETPLDRENWNLKCDEVVDAACIALRADGFAD